jgi:hypothetical protein
MCANFNGGDLLASLNTARRVRDELDCQYPAGRLYPIEDLNDICEFTYTYLADLCAEHIIGYFERVAARDDVTFRRSPLLHGPVCFLFGKVVYACRVGPGISDPRVLCVSVAKSVATDVARPMELQLSLGVTGRYRSLRVYLDESIGPLIDSVAEISHAVLTAGDRWIQTFVVAQLESLQDDLMGQVYALVRRPFPSDVARAIRVYLVDPARGGGVFMDEEARHNTLELFSGYSYISHEKAPVELLAGLLVARFGHFPQYDNSSQECDGDTVGYQGRTCPAYHVSQRRNGASADCFS